MIHEFLLLLKHELLLCIILFLILILKIADHKKSNDQWILIVNVLLFINLIAGFLMNINGEIFNGMFSLSDLGILQKNILNLGILVVSLQAQPYLKTHRHAPEFYMLLIATLIGMFLMISSGNLLLFYIGLEMATIPLAALVNFNLKDRNSSEAGMKMILSSAFSSAILLLGISLVYGMTGSLSFAEINTHLTTTSLQLFAFVLLFTGFAFKLSAVPFHFWTADVYEGSPTPVAAYLSVVSKASVAFVFISVLYHVFGSMANTWYVILFVTAVLTIGVGNLFAIRQDNLKRFLAFSSIAQVGFILIGISAGTPSGQAAAIYFLLIYLFSNLGAFGVITLVSAVSAKEKISDYKGFYKTNPVLTWVLTLSLFSLAGIPPTAGFFGKFFLLMAGGANGNYLLVGFAAINMIISMYYYLRIVKAMFMDNNDSPIEHIKVNLLPGIALMICMIGLLVTGFIGTLYSYIQNLSSGI